MRLGLLLAMTILSGLFTRAWAKPSAPPDILPVREIYCPAHFGNSYEVMSAQEMAGYLLDMKWMGFNSYSDWLTTTDVNDPYTPAHADEKGARLLRRKKVVYLAAQKAGLKLNAIVCPNHVYLNQAARRGIGAKRGRRIQGQLICPSTEEGRRIILGNFRNWFADFARAGIRLNVLTAFAYDYGGCACDKCRPWILTSARLTKEIHGIAGRYHPGIRPWLCSWWWNTDEHRIFNEWAAKEAPGWLKGMTMHIEYGRTRPKEIAVPAGCRKLAFVHIGYAERRGYATYGKMGPVLSLKRLPQTITELKRLGFGGYQAYSEGVLDDANKMVLAGISSGKCADTRDALTAYAKKFFSAGDSDATRWAELLAQCAEPRNPADIRKRLDALAKVPGAPWRIEHWRSRLRLVEHAQARDANSFLDEQEKLYRSVWGLGEVKHVLNPAVGRPKWARRSTKKPAKTVEMLPEQ